MLRDGEVREVTIGELNRATSATVRSLADGERLVVTRHGQPQAVALSPRDAMELLAAPAFPALADAARHDLNQGEVFSPWQNAGPFRIAFARAAAEKYARTVPRDRQDLRLALSTGEADGERPLWLPSGRRLVPFSFHDPDVALVHDLIDARPLERELIGEEIWRARLRRDLDRHLHGRTPWQVAEG